MPTGLSMSLGAFSGPRNSTIVSTTDLAGVRMGMAECPSPYSKVLQAMRPAILLWASSLPLKVRTRAAWSVGSRHDPLGSTALLNRLSYLLLHIGRDLSRSRRKGLTPALATVPNVVNEQLHLSDLANL